MADLNLKGGEIFAIPLFIPYETDMQDLVRNFIRNKMDNMHFVGLLVMKEVEDILLRFFRKLEV